MINISSVQHIPKVDLHVHLEGTITPVMVKKIAAKNNIDIPNDLFDDNLEKYVWPDDGTAQGALLGFVRAYDLAASVLRTPSDYADITYDYLMRAASENCIYAEITITADHGIQCGMTYPEMMQGIMDGYLKARAQSGIEARFIATCVRHYGVDAAHNVAKIYAENPHPYVTGFGMAGDENAETVAEFAPAFFASGIENFTAHAGEAAGPESVRDAKKHLKIRRFGHMVRAIEDDALMKDLVAIKAVPEVCVSSNLCLKVYDDYKQHPLRKFFDAGLKVTLGSDDPTFFDTSIGKEYAIAKKHFGFTDAELIQISRNAVEESFVEDSIKETLFAQLDMAIAA